MRGHLLVRFRSVKIRRTGTVEGIAGGIQREVRIVSKLRSPEEMFLQLALKDLLESHLWVVLAVTLRVVILGQ